LGLQNLEKQSGNLKKSFFYLNLYDILTKCHAQIVKADMLLN